MSFKIIALEILKGCDNKHSKLLEKNKLYYFYNDYSIKSDKIAVKENFNIYSFLDDAQQSDLTINISAIVGKNGMGKSTIVEFIIKAINNLFYRYREDNKEEEFHEVDKVEGLELNIYYQKNKSIYRLYIINDEYKVFKYDENNENPREQSDFKLDDFFYTEVINYSLYAYNSNQEGNWIDKIFHKNDGYQTPIVLNPWRKEGNIDINTENFLVFQRLLANLLKYDAQNKLNLNLGDNNLSAEYILLKLRNETDENGKNYYQEKAQKEWKIDLSIFDDNFREKLIKDLINRLYKNKKINSEIDSKIVEFSKCYVLYKIISICKKYDDYRDENIDFSVTDFGDKQWQKILDILEKDTSHITFKLRQIINYLVCNHIQYSSENDISMISTKELAEKIKTISKGENIINFLPPPIFGVDIGMKSTKSNNDKIKFSSLSSGEKQQIYSINSIFYHLINLESIPKDGNRISYEYINIILEEIELYFHPEYQRTYIYKLIEGIKKLNLKKIKGINFIFVTHSPFILSDIPKQNVLFLGEGEIENKNTFAGNISMMLSSSFFMKESLIGEFSKRKINQLLEKLNQQKEENRKEEYGKNKDNKEYEKYKDYKAKMIMDEEEKQYAFNFIDLIDEPILKNKLVEMFCEAYPDFCESKEQTIKVQRLKTYAKQLGLNPDDIEIK